MRRSRNYDNYGSHNQVATGYKDNSYQENDRRSSGYRSYGKEDYKKFRTRESSEYNPSPEDMLNGPCHIHSAFVDGKRVSPEDMLNGRNKELASSKPKQADTSPTYL
jgi:hypothetical protein